MFYFNMGNFIKLGSIDYHKKPQPHQRFTQKLPVVEMIFAANEMGLSLILVDEEGLLSIWQVRSA